MRSLIFLSAALALGACATTAAPYGPAEKPGAVGYASQQIESDRYQVSYTDTEPRRARDLALLRAAQVTLENGMDWFEITNSYTDVPQSSASRSSVSLGGSVGSHGRSSGVGVGVSVGLPLGGGNGKVTEVLEITTGAGEKPDRPSVYDARVVEFNLGNTLS